MEKIIEITKEQFGNFVVFEEGMYNCENAEDTPEKFQASIKPLRFFIATHGIYPSTSYTNRLIIIDPSVVNDPPMLSSCDWWILDCDHGVNWPGIPIEATHLMKGFWCGVKWFTMDYCTGYDGEDFVEEMNRDMQLLKDVLVICGTYTWED